MTDNLSNTGFVKRFLSVLAPMAALVGIVAFLFFYLDARHARAILASRETDSVRLKTGAIGASFEATVSDLMFLSRLDDVRKMPARPTERWRRAVAGDFLQFSETQGLYGRISLRDASGAQAVRVEFSGGRSRIVPVGVLGRAPGPRYFKEAMALERGGIYVSPMQLAPKEGKTPARPIMRFATPVFDLSGRKRGVVAIDFLGARLLEPFDFSPIEAPGSLMLLNPGGFWLHSPNPADEWGFMYKGREDRTFAKRYPAAWKRINGTDSGQYRDADGFFTYRTVYPLAEAYKALHPEPGPSRAPGMTGYYWKVVSRVDPAVLTGITRGYIEKFVTLYAALFVLLFFVSWQIALLAEKRKRAEEDLVRKAEELERSNLELMELNDALNFEVALRKSAEGAVLKTVESLEAKGRELEAVNRELEAFTYSASHDLQEPLRMVASYVQLLARRYRGRLDKSADDYIGFAVEGVGRMQNLIDDLLDYSKAAKTDKSPGVDCNAVLARAVADLRASITESGAAIESGDLPHVTADPVQLGRVFLNLIGNAIKYRGAEPPRIRVSAERADTEWVFSVEDNGVGIDRLYFNQIFEVFKRIPVAGGRRGSGIGLSLCKKIVENHGGRIWVESEAGKGSTFRFTIPA